MKCSNCNQPLSASDRFCGECGTRVDSLEKLETKTLASKTTAETTPSAPQDLTKSDIDNAPGSSDPITPSSPMNWAIAFVSALFARVLFDLHSVLSIGQQINLPSISYNVLFRLVATFVVAYLIAMVAVQIWGQQKTGTKPSGAAIKIALLAGSSAAGALAIYSLLGVGFMGFALQLYPTSLTPIVIESALTIATLLGVFFLFSRPLKS